MTSLPALSQHDSFTRFPWSGATVGAKTTICASIAGTLRIRTYIAYSAPQMAGIENAEKIADSGGAGSVRRCHSGHPRRLLVLVGVARLGRGQSGGFSLRNVGINIGSTNTQTNTVGNVNSQAAKSGKPDWVGLGIAVFGFLTALVGLFKG
jgi:hypothetical protein